MKPSWRERRNVSNSKRQELTGRGTVGKTAVVGAKDRETNRVVAEVIESPDQETLKDCVIDNVGPSAMVHTDYATAYDRLPFEHETVGALGRRVGSRTSAHQRNRELLVYAQPRSQGYCHKTSVKHSHRYVNEYAERHKPERKGTEDQMRETVCGMIGKELRRQDLTALNLQHNQVPNASDGF